MVEIKCFLCCKKAFISKQGTKRGLLRKELTIYFLVNKLLKVSTSLCTGFLEKEGNPSNWLDCCGPCSDLIQNVEIVSKKIRKLQNKRKSLVQEIENFILKEHKREVIEGDTDNTEEAGVDVSVSRSIRAEISLRKKLEVLEVSQRKEDNGGAVTIKPEPLDITEEEEDFACIPPSPSSPTEQTHDESSESELSGSDTEDAGLHECKKCGKQYKYVNSFQCHIKICKSTQEEDFAPGDQNQATEKSNSKYVSDKVDDGNRKIKIETENSPLRNPSPTALDNYDCEEWQPQECDDSLEEGTGSGETDKNENRRKRGRPRKFPDGHYLKQQNSSTANENNLKSDNEEMRRSRPRKFNHSDSAQCDSIPHDESLKDRTIGENSKTLKISRENNQRNLKKKATTYKVKSKNQFTCKCGGARKSSNAVINHRRNCKMYTHTYKSVGTRNPSSSKQQVTKDYKINHRETEKSENSKNLSRTTNRKRKEKALIIIKRFCLCSKKFSCRHKCMFRKYKTHCSSKGKDFEEMQKFLVSESEDVKAKEVGYYGCRNETCRFGFKDRSVYGSHLISNHMEHLKRRLKCKCCKKCFVIEEDLKMHIESTEECKIFIEANPDEDNSQVLVEFKKKRGRPSKNSKIENETLTEDPDPTSSSSGSSDEYELIDDDEQLFRPGNSTTTLTVAAAPEEAESFSNDGKSRHEGSKVEQINTSPGAAVVEKVEDSTTAETSEKSEKRRLFRTFRCLTCKTGFKTPVLLNSHIRGIHKAQERPFVCHLCPGEHFRVFLALETHYIELHQGVLINSCPVIEGGTEEHKYRVLREKEVEKVTEFKDVAKKRVELSDLSDPDWDPENMEEYQSSRRQTKTRRYIKSDEYDPRYTYECQICEIKYETENSYVRHNLFTHLEEVGVGEADLTFHCDQCNKKYSTGCLLHAHKRTIHEGKKYPLECTVCGEEFKFYKNYLEHIADSHSKDGPVLCDICNIRFCDEQSKIIHVRRSHGDDNKPYHCSVCTLGYATDMDLRYHRLKHLRTEEYMCEFCSIVFKAQHLLKRHQMTKHFEAMGVDPLKCQDCGKIFGDENYLKNHIQNVHVKDHNFICSQCAKGFNKQEALDKHFQERHVEGKKFMCSQCPKQYWKKINLEQHEKKAHSETQIFQCNICTKKKIFKTEKLLNNHMERHSLLYQCHICSKIFKKKEYLRIHLKGVHSVTVKSTKAIKGYKADEVTVKEVLDRSSQIASRQKSSLNEKKRKAGKIKMHRKKRKESKDNESECSYECDNVESTTLSADCRYNAEPIPLIVPQPQMSTSSLTPSMLMTPRHPMDQSYSVTSNPLLGYTNNQHFMVPQSFHASVQQNQLPSTSNYFHRNTQGHNHSFAHYSDPYEPFPQN